MEISNQTLGKEKAKIIYHHFAAGKLLTYQHITLQKCYFQKNKNILYKYYFVCLSETYLDLSIPSDYASLDLEAYKLVHADHLSNAK